MGQVARAAKSARANVSAKSLAALADACVADAKDVKVGPVLAPFALQGFFRALANGLSGPVLLGKGGPVGGPPQASPGRAVPLGHPGLGPVQPADR